MKESIDVRVAIAIVLVFIGLFFAVGIMGIKVEAENEDLKIQIKEMRLSETLRTQNFQREIQIKEMQLEYQKELLKTCRGW